jgi:hypothetical protein
VARRWFTRLGSNREASSSVHRDGTAEEATSHAFTIDMTKNVDERAHAPEAPKQPRDVNAERHPEFESKVQDLVYSGCPGSLAVDFLILQERVETLERALLTR